MGLSLSFDARMTARQELDLCDATDPRRYFVQLEGSVNNTSVEFRVYGAEAQALMDADPNTLFTVTVNQGGS